MAHQVPLPEFWLDEQTLSVVQVNNVTRVTYFFTTLSDAKRGKTIAEKVAKDCLRGRNKRPLYPEYIYQAIIAEGINVMTR